MTRHDIWQSTIIHKTGLLITVLLGAVLGSPLLTWGQASYESPPVFKASDILPPEWVQGPYHRVDETVVNDGYMNHYTIESQFGTFKADSTAELRRLIAEVNAIGAMAALQTTTEFAAAAQAAGSNRLQAAGSIIDNPTKTLSNTLSGVSKMVQKAGDSFFGDPASDAEDSSWKNLVGLSKTKREYAARFNVDVYSSNKVLQEQLERVAWVGYAGDISASTAMSLIPGAGLAASIAGNVDTMTKTPATTTPDDLRRANREQLEGMEIDPAIIDAFMQNTVFSPTYQTLVVSALAAMKGAAGRGELLGLAAKADNEDAVRFRQRLAAMYAGYHKTVAPIARFISIDGLPAALTADNTLVFMAPIDYLAWIEYVGKRAETATEQIEAMPEVAKKQVWLAGSLSPLARQSLGLAGWQVEDGAEARLLGGE